MFKIVIIALMLVILWWCESIRMKHYYSGPLKILIGSFPNFASVIVLSLVASFFTREKNITKLTHGFFVGVVIYELIQAKIPDRTFDFFDILFSFLGWIVLLMLYKSKNLAK